MDGLDDNDIRHGTVCTASAGVGDVQLDVESWLRLKTELNDGQHHKQRQHASVRLHTRPPTSGTTTRRHINTTQLPASLLVYQSLYLGL